MAVKNYQAIARSKITHPSEVSRPPRILVYSRNKKGKSTFCTSAPDVLILDPESGTDGMVKRNPNVWKLDKWTELDDPYHYLKSGKHPFKWVALDGLTRLSGMSLRYVMSQEEERDITRKPGMVQKQDYGKSGKLLESMINNFCSLPMGIIFTCQERIIEVKDDGGEADDEDADTTQILYVPDLPKGARGMANSVVDVIGRLYTVKADHPRLTGQTYTQRRLWVEPHIAYDTGYRSDYRMPPFIKSPTVPKLVGLLREGKVRHGSA